MNVLLIGSGAREHALGLALARSPGLVTLIACPGNPGLDAVAAERWTDLDPTDGAALAERAVARRIDLVVVGPEAPLVAGLADAMRAVGIPTFGPSADAAALEGSKAFAKAFLDRHRIPTAASRTFGAAERSDAEAYVRDHPLPVVLKASGLAGGKGVVIAETTDAALDTLGEMLSGAAFGEAGESVVIEEFMLGEEASLFVLTDGLTHRLLPTAQDHKRLLDGDLGPNTGGMGAYAPAPVVTTELLDEVERRIVRPTLDGMKTEGRPYIGLLYIGLMLTVEGPKVVEFNCRFGDPEAEVVLPLVRADWLTILHATATHSLVTLPDDAFASGNCAAACVVLAAAGYPGPVRTGDVIRGLDEAAKLPGVTVLHGATRETETGEIVTAGGRVLCVVGVGETLAEAVQIAYSGCERISFDGMQLRRDIGRRGLARESAA